MSPCGSRSGTARACTGRRRRRRDSSRCSDAAARIGRAADPRMGPSRWDRAGRFLLVKTPRHLVRTGTMKAGLMSPSIRADGLRQAVGVFNLLLGALFIVAPNRLDAPMYAPVGFCASGLGF